MNTALHNHLRLHSGETASLMWADLYRLRRMGIPHDDLPQTSRGFVTGLMDLRTAGLAEKSGDLWLWLPAKLDKPATVRQESLF